MFLSKFLSLLGQQNIEQIQVCPSCNFQNHSFPVVYDKLHRRNLDGVVHTITVVGQIRARTEKFRSSFYPHSLTEWNKLDPELRESSSVSVLKNLFSQIRPPANSVYGIHNPKGIAFLTQLRMGLSKLNFHKFKHNFKDKINPMCPVNDGIEDTEHFLLLCNSFRQQRCSLLAGVNDVLRACRHSESADINMLQLLLYGNKSLPLEANKMILNLTIKYISETERFG